MIINKYTAETLIEFALKHNAVVEQREFAHFNRYILLTTRGTIAIRSNKNNDTKGIYELLAFNGFKNRLNKIEKEFTAIETDLSSDKLITSDRL